MTEINLKIWGREFTLSIDYDCYEGEDVLPEQENALNSFLEHTDVINESEELVKNYCVMIDSDRIAGGKIDNIFKYVIPKSLYVKRRTDKRIVALMCKYKFNPDDGLAVVFQNEEFSKIGTQNIIL